MNNINELGNQTDTSSSSDAVVLSTSASDKFFQICIELMSKSKLFWLIFLPLALSPSAMVDAGLQFHQFLRFLQSTQPSTVLVLVPSTSETVAASTSAFVGIGRKEGGLHPFYEDNLYTTVTWYWAEGGRLTPPSMKSIYTPLVTIFTIFQPYSRFNKETCLL
ncbi:uncharacterized protein LOC124807774 isoform X14 [Hydra vulgaris]|uniref:uncharacterized protein LOC124807774 isoform X14 n=1 Tax=Hydra vulgaris TaxID=6087 RepID=UPI0032E9EFA9